MACADVDMDIHRVGEEPSRANRQEEFVYETVRQYKATDLVPDNNGELYELLLKQPAVLGMISGFFCIGMGILFAVSQDINQSLFSLFRVSQLTGTLFIFAGVISNLLFKYPALLTVSLKVNCGCIIVAVVAVCLISVDLAHWKIENQHFLRIEVMTLCVIGLEVLLSAVLCYFICKGKHAKSP